MAHESLFYDDLTQATPEVTFQDPSFAALTKAFADALQKFLTHVDMTKLDELRVKARVPTLPEALLDHLGLLDFRAVGYDTSMAMNIKRQLVMSACYDNAHLGTKTSVEKLVNLVFGSAHIEEWWQYGGTPYRWRIRTTDPQLDPNRIAILNRAILATKPVTRWPDPVARVRNVGDDLFYVGAALFRVRIRRVGQADAG
jgi:phage tail P2-like protein